MQKSKNISWLWILSSKVLSKHPLLQNLWKESCLRNPACGSMIRCFLIFQKPHEVHSILAGFFQLSAGKNAALVSVCHYLEYHSRVGDRFSSSGRIRCVQFSVIQFLKLGAGHSDGCILWHFNFTVQYKNQLIISLNCGILSLRFRVFHRSLILTQKTTSTIPKRAWLMWFFHGRILQQAHILRKSYFVQNLQKVSPRGACESIRFMVYSLQHL